jgi:hypothetical protein
MGRLVGLEILDAAQRFGDPSVYQHVILERLEPAAPGGACEAANMPGGSHEN